MKSKRIKGEILRAIAKLLELDEDYFVYQLSDKAPAYARFNYYPPCPRPDLVLGVKPHSDVYALTVLLVDKDVGGLQVLRDGTWYNVTTLPNYTLLINIGFTMEVDISEPPQVYLMSAAFAMIICSSFVDDICRPLTLSLPTDYGQRDLQGPSAQGCN